MKCCKIDCGAPAEWEIRHYPYDPHDDTHACEAHVGELLTDAKEHIVVPMVRQVNYDLPPGYYLAPECSRGRSHQYCPVCKKYLVEVDRIEGLPIAACPDRCEVPKAQREVGP